MQKKHKILVSAGGLLAGVVALVGMTSVMVSSGVSAKGTGLEFPYHDLTVSVLPEFAVVSAVTAEWGTVRVGPKAVTLAEEESAAGFEQTTGNTSTYTDIPDSDVTIVDASISVSLPGNSADPVASPSSYKIERTMEIDGASTGVWFVLDDDATGTLYTDDDVVYKGSYTYRVTPETADGTEQTSVEVAQVASARQIFSGRWDNGQIVLEVKPSPLQPAQFQYATIREFDHVERDARHSTTITVVNKRHLSDGITTISFTPTWDDGDIRYYTMSLYTKRSPNHRFVLARLRVMPIAIRQGDVEPSKPGKPSVSVGDDGKIQLAWDTNNTARESVGYEVKRRPLRPINQAAPTHVTATVASSVTLPAHGTADPPYEYSITPLKRDVTRGTSVSDNNDDEGTVRPKCLNPVTGAEPMDIEILYLFPDITKPWGTGTPLTFDVLAVDIYQRPCGFLDARDFYLQRMFYYKHMVDPSCPQSDLSCTVLNLSIRRLLRGGVHSDIVLGVNGGTVEDLYDTPAVVWGVGGWRAVGFTDHDYSPGRYGAIYRACLVGVDECSLWIDVPIENIGVSVIPFLQGEYPTDFEDREFGPGLMEISTWPVNP
jgi:hypothetical protein